jgi:aminoglycoside phosphotransferase (APT) family kinase protein
MAEVTTDPDAGADPDAPRWSRADLALLRQAARGRWSVPDAVKGETLYQLTRLLTAPQTSERARLSAARTLATLDQIDQTDERQELERTRVEILVTARRPDESEDLNIDAGAAAAALAAAWAYTAERGGEVGEAEVPR